MIFKEHYEELFLEEVSPAIKKMVSSGSDDDPIDVFDEFSKTQSSPPIPLNISM